MILSVHWRCWGGLCLLMATAAAGLPGAQPTQIQPIVQTPRPQDEQAGQPLQRIAFGSCAAQDQPQPIWSKITQTDPQLFVFLGDNIYGDTEDMEVMRRKYQQLAARQGFRTLCARCPILATWDDHDYGVNDGGRDYPKRRESQQVFLDFFGIPQSDPRRQREGLYQSHIFGPSGKRTQLIVLDTRYHRSPLKRRPDNRGYIPSDDPQQTMLGQTQWAWLEEQLRQPAELRIVVSSVQVVPEDHRFEKWANLPRERKKLFELIKTTQANGVLFISGDRHLAELSMQSDTAAGYPMYDLTSSGLNRGSKRWRPQEVNRHRLGSMTWGDNFGLIVVDWSRADPLIRLQIRDVDGDIRLQYKIPLSTLKPAGGRRR